MLSGRTDIVLRHEKFRTMLQFTNGEMKHTKGKKKTHTRISEDLQKVTISIILEIRKSLTNMTHTQM